MNHETFWTLLHDTAHWEFELFLQLIFDVIIAGLLWPLARKHWQHHIARDQRDMVYNWSMNPVAKSAGHAIETPEGLCDGCGGMKKTLPGSELCMGCGEVKVVIPTGCALCDAGVPMSRNGSFHCVDDAIHAAVGSPCTRYAR